MPRLESDHLPIEVSFKTNRKEKNMGKNEKSQEEKKKLK